MKVVVVGAGMGGLACALRLAATGHDVTVYERANEPGGLLATWEHRTEAGRFRFDTGPSLLTLPQVFAELLRAAGSTVEDELDLVELDPVVRHIFPDGSTLDTCADPDELARRIGTSFGSAAAAQWSRLWLRSERAWRASWRDVLTAPAVTPAALARLAWRLGDLAAVAPGRSLRGLGRSQLRDPRLRMLLDRYATYAGSDPRRAPAALTAIVHAELAYGGWYLRGGLGTLTAALVHRAAALGIALHMGTEVSTVEASGGRAVGVRLADGTRVPADVVVANADALSVYSGLWPHRRAARLTRRSLSGFVLLLGVRGRTAGLAHHTVFFPPDYDAEFDALFGPTAQPVPDPAVYLSVPDDPAVRPDGHEAWFVLVNAAPHGTGPGAVDWHAPGLAQAYAGHVLDTLAARGLDVRDRILFMRIRTPADLEHATGSPGGAIYGTPRHGLAGLMRPANHSPLPGLYLVGGSVHPGGGLPMVALSGQIVAGMIGPAR